MENVISEETLKLVRVSPPPWDGPLVATTGDVKPIPMVQLAGEFLIQTNLKGDYLTAVGGR